jgi:hypothetical protein
MLVLSLTLTAGIIGFSINKSKTRTVENVTGFQKYTTARNIAHTGVNMMLRALDRNDTTLVNPLQAGQKVWMVQNLMSGVCSVSIRLKNPTYKDTVVMTSKAMFMDTVKTMDLTLRRQPVPFPTPREAVGLHIPTVGFDINSGSVLIDGQNHDINGNLLPPSADDVPGVGVLTAGDTTKVINEENQFGGQQILGTKDVVQDSLIPDPSLFVNEYINGADTEYTSGTYGGTINWGSPSNPWITYCHGNVKFDGTVNGYGILVVSGDITFAGNFNFRGLVIAFNDVAIDVDFSTGTPNVIGGLIMGGSAAGYDYRMKGTSKVVYSKEALEMARYINKLQVYRVMKWYE